MASAILSVIPADCRVTGQCRGRRAFVNEPQAGPSAPRWYQAREVSGSTWDRSLPDAKVAVCSGTPAAERREQALLCSVCFSFMVSVPFSLWTRPDPRHPDTHPVPFPGSGSYLLEPLSLVPFIRETLSPLVW